MKIIHLIQKAQLRGAEVFASQLGNHLVKQGHEVILICLFNGTTQLPFTGKIIHLKANAGKRFFDVTAWKKLAAIIADEKPDVIQANAGDTLKYAVFSKLLFKWKQPIIFRNASMISLYIKSMFTKLLNAFFFNYVDTVVSVSKASQADFISVFPQYKKRIVNIPVGIEIMNEISSDSNAINTKNQSPILVHVGGFSFEKNHAGLISIFKNFLALYPSAVLHLVGDGPLLQQTKDLVKGKGIEASVVFHGFQKNPLQYIKSADVLLLPSIIEGLPGVILEAFYCRTPVVAYNTGGISEVVINDYTGKLVTKNDEAAFCNAITNILQDKAATKQLIDNAYELVTGKYLNAEIATAFITIYQQVTGLNNQAHYQTANIQMQN